MGTHEGQAQKVKHTDQAHKAQAHKAQAFKGRTHTVQAHKGPSTNVNHAMIKHTRVKCTKVKDTEVKHTNVRCTKVKRSKIMYTLLESTEARHSRQTRKCQSHRHYSQLIVTECIVCVSGYDLLFFSLSFLFFDWVGVLWPHLSKVLKPVRQRPFSPQCPCRGRLFVCCCGRCSRVQLRGELTLLPGWCANTSYVIATSDLWLFIHASNLLPSLPSPLPY